MVQIPHKVPAATFGGAERFELLLLLFLSALHGQCRRLLVDRPQQRVLHTHGAQVPACDEAAANERRAESHYLTHQHGGQDVGQLVDNPYGGIHVCLVQESFHTADLTHIKFDIHITAGLIDGHSTAGGYRSSGSWRLFKSLE